jgi:hypothetical protein
VERLFGRAPLVMRSADFDGLVAALESLRKE